MSIDCSNLLLGSDCPLFTYSISTQGKINIDISLTLSKDWNANTYSLIKDIIQTALIVKKLEIVSNPNIFNNSSINSNSKTAFLSNVHTSVISFHTFVNNYYINNKSPSLIDLKTNILNSQDKFKHIYWLYLKSIELKSNEFLSLLYNYSLFGDSLLKDISKSYFNSILSSSYNQIITNWLFLGELNDIDLKNENFFITKSNDNNTNNNNNNINTFIYNKSIIPLFIDSDTCFKIYQIGKSINYLKNYLNDQLWCNQFYQNNYSNDILNLNINYLYNILLNHLDSLILLDFKSEIKNLHNFLLFRNGDLIDIILQNGSKILNDKPSNLSSYQLINLLQDSLNSSSIINNLKPSIYNRIDARLLNINLSNSKGYNLFTLDFKLLPHINYIISLNYKEYLRVFNFLFQIVNLKNQLFNSWKSSSKINVIKFLSKLKIYQKKFNLIRHQFISFINSIFSFIENEILIFNYNILLSKLSADDDNNANNDNINHSSDLILQDNKLLPLNLNNSKKLLNLDDLNSLHSDYILSISRSELFTNSNNLKIPLNQVLFKLIKIIEKFIHLSNEFQNLINDLLQLENSSFPNNDLYEYQSLLFKKIKNINKTLNSDIIDQFEINMKIFIHSLKSSKNQNLNYLSQMLEM